MRHGSGCVGINICMVRAIHPSIVTDVSLETSESRHSTACLQVRGSSVDGQVELLIPDGDFGIPVYGSVGLKRPAGNIMISLAFDRLTVTMTGKVME